MNVLIVHGGAGKWQDQALARARAGIPAALRCGYETLKRTGSALQAVMAAVRQMEDDPIFNCGKGSQMTINGEIQMDAAVMTSDGRFGAVGALEAVQHPIDVAYKVMTETSHLLIVGEGAKKLARFWGFPRFNPMTEKARRRLAELRRRGRSSFMPEFEDYLALDTVGAVARDRYGRFAVANSTGGYAGKLPGRIGDTPIFGAGTWACPHGAATGTGLGEELIRRFLSKTVCDLMRKHSAQKAVDISLEGTKRVGMIAIDRQGNIGLGHTTRAMPWGWVRNGEEKSGS